MNNRLWVKNRDEQFYRGIKKLIPSLIDCRCFLDPFILSIIEPWSQNKAWQYIREELTILDGSVARNETTTLDLILRHRPISSLEVTNFFFYTYPLLTQILSKISLRFNQYIVAMGRLDLLDSKVHYGHLIHHARTKECLISLMEKKKRLSINKLLMRIINVDNTHIFPILVKMSSNIDIQIIHLERCIKRGRVNFFETLISYPNLSFTIIQDILIKTVREDNIVFFSIIYDKINPSSQLHYHLLEEAITNESLNIYKSLLLRKRFSRSYEGRILKQILLYEDKRIEFLTELFLTGYRCSINYLPSILHQAHKSPISHKILVEYHIPLLNSESAFIIMEDMIKKSDVYSTDILTLLDHYGKEFDRFSVISLLSKASHKGVIQKLNDIL